MKLYQLMQAYDFGEVFPVVNEMFPNAHLHRDVFEKAFRMLQTMKPTFSKKAIRYQVIDASDKGETFFGAPDACFQTTWDAVLGKEVKKERGVELNDLEMVANSFLNIVLQGKHPLSFDADFRKLMR